MVLVGAALWGASGVAVQFLFQHKNLDPTWLVTVRMFLAGLVMLLYEVIRGGSIFAPWKNSSAMKKLIAFGILGMMGTQYTYYLAINYGNAATATVLQYLMPVIVLSYSVWQSKRQPQGHEVLSVVLAMIGTYLLITRGQWNSLAISAQTLLWGIFSAFAFAFYTIYPRDLLMKYSSSSVVGWGMIVGSVVLMPFCITGPIQGLIDWETLVVMAIVILFGTIVAFYTYLESTKYIKPSEVGALASVEPLASVILSVILLKVDFGLIDGLGVACILGTVFILSQRK